MMEGFAQMDTAVAGLTLAVMAQIAGLVWGASKLSSAVGGLKDAVKALNDVVRHLETVVSGLDRRVAVLEDRSMRKE